MDRIAYLLILSLLLAKIDKGVSDVSWSSIMFFNGVTDVNPPKINIEQPSNHSVVSRTIDVLVLAWDESGIGNIELYINNDLIMVNKSNSRINRWSTELPKEEWNVIKVKAYDIYGNSAEKKIEVYVPNVN